jgi:AGCS family alanine or glycine:cation symporter
MGFLKETLTIYLVVPMIFGAGLYLSYYLKWIQFTQLKKAWQLTFEKSSKSNFSSFAAVATVLGGNLGTGNIAGIAVALSTGGPGSLFWMWIMASLGAIVKYAGCYLGLKYRIQNKTGKYLGGPMYYLEKGVGNKFLARFYCIATLCSALTVGNLVQMNSVALPLTQLQVPPTVSGVIMSLLVAFVIFGGLKQFANIVSKVVPFMAIGYLACCLAILSAYYQEIWPAVLLIIKGAFVPTSVVGGATGYGILHVVRVGFDRGLFATDAGAGIAPMVHSSVEPKEGETLMETAVNQGIISMLSPFIVIIVCTLTGLVLMVTGAWQMASLESTNLCFSAFCFGFNWEHAGHIVTVTLFLFAFTTMLTWAFCADCAMVYLLGPSSRKFFRILFIAVIPLGSIFKVQLVWEIADISMNIMLIINMIGVIFLAKEVVEKRKFTAQY